MNQEFISNFSSFDENAFTQLINHLGYLFAGCYRIQQQDMTYIFGNQPKQSPWPAHVAFDLYHYTENLHRGLPIGWHKPKFPAPVKKIWPNSIIAYFPEQELSNIKLVVFLVPTDRKKHVTGELNGALESICRRIQFWCNGAELKFFINEIAFGEHVRRLSLDMQTLIDHELRTPLSVIEGYNMVAESSPDPELFKTFGAIVKEQTKVAIEAVGKLGLVLRSGFEKLYEKADTTLVNVRELVNEVCERISKDETLSSMQGKRPNIHIVIPDDFVHVQVSAVPRLMQKALWEVLQNAVIHSQHGDIKVTVYESDGSAIIDIVDDGAGVPLGHEDLIFLRFFQGSNMSKVKRGHRGLGLGLYLARHIAEQHMGQLNFIRQGSKGGLFRFVWPITMTEMEQNNKRRISA